MSGVNTVLIVGGGIAGLTAATALARRGVRCEVVELTDQPVGAGISLLNRALDSMQEIGVLDRLLEKGVPKYQEFFAYFDAAGEPVATQAMPDQPPSALPRAIVIHRAELARALKDAATQAGVEVRVGVTVTELTQDAEKVTATFTDGSQRSYDLVVGADGVRSSIRSMVFGDTTVPQYTGTTMFRWVTDGVPDVGPSGFYQGKWMIIAMRLRDGSVYMATNRHYPARPDRMQPEAVREVVREHLASFDAPLLVALRERLAEDASIIVSHDNWLLEPDPWYRGRVLLIGDAAHATTPALASGAGMAMEDAVVLGQEVAAGGTVEEMLQRFMRRRFERVRLVVETSAELDRMLKRGDSVPEMNALRAHAMKVLSSPY